MAKKQIKKKSKAPALPAGIAKTKWVVFTKFDADDERFKIFDSFDSRQEAIDMASAKIEDDCAAACVVRRDTTEGIMVGLKTTTKSFRVK